MMGAASIAGERVLLRRGTPPRSAFLAAVVCLAMLAANARPDDAGLATSLLAAVLQHKVLWLCACIALFEAARAGARPLAVADVAAAVPALAAAALLAEWGVWSGLALSAALWRHAVTDARQRRGMSLLLALSLHGLVAGLCGELASDAWLALDARIAAWVAGWFWPGIELSGTALHSPGGITVILVWGCGSLSHAGELLLLCWSLALLQCEPAPRAAPIAAAGPALVLAALAATVVLLNGARIAAMTRSLADYEYLHGPEGSALYRLTLLLIAALLSMVCAHVANRRNRGAA